VSPREDDAIARSLRGLRERRIAPVWDRMDEPDAVLFESLWEDLVALGLTAIGLPEEHGGVELEASSLASVLTELGAAAPALGCALIGHLTATALLVNAGVPIGEGRGALAFSPLDARPAARFALAGSLSGAVRVGLAWPSWIVVPARRDTEPRLCVVALRQRGVRFEGRPSSHGLRLFPFGTLTLEGAIPSYEVAWPEAGRTAALADGLVTALLCGMASELADRAMSFAFDRYQGGKMIRDHDAVRALVGPIELARRPLAALALATLTQDEPGDGGASAFAADIVRQAGLDAIQTMGGSGYMQDYGVERYLRDAGTLETSWIHAAARRREIARARFAEMER